MSFATLVADQRDALTRADRALVDVILSHPLEAAYWRAEELSERAAVHPAAATRLAQRLGLDGYPALRSLLQEEYRTSRGRSGEAAERVRHDVDAAGEDILALRVRAEAASLAALVETVTQEQLDEVADRIHHARRVYVLAQGNAVVVADMLARRLQRFGRIVVLLTGATRDVAERLVGITAEDTLVALAFRRPPRVLAPAIRAAHVAGADVTLVTDTLHSLDPAPDRVIAASRGDVTGFQSLVVPMTILNALVLTISARHPEATMPRLEELQELLDTFQP